VFRWLGGALAGIRLVCLNRSCSRITSAHIWQQLSTPQHMKTPSNFSLHTTEGSGFTSFYPPTLLLSSFLLG